MSNEHQPADVEIVKDISNHSHDKELNSEQNSWDNMSRSHSMTDITVQTETSNAALMEGSTTNEEGENSKDFSQEKKGTAFGVLFNLINTTVGSGILALPFAFRELGLVCGAIALLIMGVIATSTLHFLNVSCHARHRYSYKELAVDVFRTKVAGIIFELTIIIVGAGALIGYVIIVGQFSESLFALLMDSLGAPESVKTFLGHRATLTAIFMLAIMFPLSILRRIQFLSYTSLLSIVSAMFVVVAVIIRSCQSIIAGDRDRSTISLVGSFDSIVTSFPIICFSLTSHVTLLPMISEMKSPSIKKVSIVGAGSVFICMTMYMTIAIAGYVLFLEETQDNVLNSFTSSDPLIIVTKISITIVVILSYPLFLFATRECFENIIFANKPFSWPRWIIQAAIISLISYIIAIAFPSIKSVLGLTGATGSTLAAFVYP